MSNDPEDELSELLRRSLRDRDSDEAFPWQTIIWAFIGVLGAIGVLLLLFVACALLRIVVLSGISQVWY